MKSSLLWMRGVPTSVLVFVLVAALMIGCGGGSGGGSANELGPGGNGGGTNPGRGPLPANVLIYNELIGNERQVRYIRPDGTGDTLLASLPGSASGGPNFTAFAASPAQAGLRFFSHQASATAPIGIYRNGSISMTGATTVIPPRFREVRQILVSSDGNWLVIVALEGLTGSMMYRVSTTGGTVTPLDEADMAALSPVDGTIVYSKRNFINGDNGDLYLRSLAANTLLGQLTDTADDETFPTFSRDGQRIVFASGPSFLESDLYQIRRDGSGRTRITSTPNQLETGPSLSSDGMTVAYAVLDLEDSTRNGLYRVATSGAGAPVLVKASTTIGSDVYWTSLEGRSRPAVGVSLSLNRVKRN